MTKKSPAPPADKLTEKPADKPADKPAAPPEKPAKATAAGASSLFLDRIEEGVAVLQLGDKELHLPRAFLPASAKEGDYLKLTLTVDVEATAKAKAETAAKRGALSKGDDGGDIAL